MNIDIAATLDDMHEMYNCPVQFLHKIILMLPNLPLKLQVVRHKSILDGSNLHM